MDLCIACLKNFQKKQAVKVLRRTVRELGSLPDKYVPEFLAGVPDIDDGHWVLLSIEEQKEHLLYALKSLPTDLLPRRNMPVSEAKAWMVVRTKACGSPLMNGVVVLHRASDWQFAMGAYLWHVPEGSGPDFIIICIVNRSSGATVDVRGMFPVEITLNAVKKGEFQLTHNYHEDMTTIVRASTRTKQLVKDWIEREAAAPVADAPEAEAEAGWIDR